MINSIYLRPCFDKNENIMWKQLSIFILMIAVTVQVSGQDHIFTSHDIFKMSSVGNVSVSPDGKFVAYAVNIPRPWNDKPGGNYSEIHLLNRETGGSRPFITGKRSIRSVSWTPDSKKITFVGRMDDEKNSQIYSMNVDGGMPVKVTDADFSIGSYQWNPNNTSIAFVASPKEKGKADLEKKGFNAEIYEEDVVDKNLYIFDLKTQKTEQITQGISIWSMEWDPAGNKLAAQVTQKNLTDHSYVFKKISIIDPKTKTVTQLLDNEGKVGEMHWSPDGKHIGFIGGADLNDPVSGSLFVVQVPNSKKFKELRNYVKDMELSVTSFAWKDDKTLLYSADESVDCSISEQAIDGESRSTVLEAGKLVFRGFAYSKGIIAISGQTPNHSGELFTLDVNSKTLKKWTDLNPWLAKKKLAKQEKISYKARDGVTVEGVLVYPLDYEDGKKYPLINYIHGGPEACVKNGWITRYSMWGQVAAAKGYFVYMPNYRGSSGRGVAYSKMDQKDMGDEEFNDVLDGIDYLVKQGKVDKDRVGIGGGSYGGYFSMWAATKHSEHFAAACSFVGISDQISKRFTTDIPWESYYSHWLVWPHEDWELVLDRSPIKYATNNKTPTLILHGKEDPRVHPSQSLELYRALKMHGKAPVRLVWYPGEGHGNRKRPAQLDYNLRTLEWFDYYLKGDNPRDKMPRKDLEYGLD